MSALIIIIILVAFIAFVGYKFYSISKEIKQVPETPIASGQIGNKFDKNGDIIVPEIYFNKEELLEYDGEKNPKVYVAIKGIVFDASESEHYRQGGSYHIFAGRDASVALAKMSFEPKDLEDTDITKLNYDQKDILDNWYQRFAGKYTAIGKVKTEGAQEAAKKVL